ncbi:MAG: YbaB/EbfC family nucleoid-associated protein [Neomegalonema sp.]|nr:YbaB/EbfC family nucleoid-associated protein [Neomegalonema sp.]
MLKGLGGLGNMGKIMQQAQELQTKMAELQTRLEEIEVEGQAGAGMVKALVTCKGALRRVEIDPSLLGNADEKEVLEDLVVAAVNDAQTKAAERAQQEMQELTAGLPIPPGMMPGL